MRVRYAVTFEFQHSAPTTHRSEVTATTPATCMARAVREAQRHLKPYRWTSVVCVLLERLDADAETDDEAAGGATYAADGDEVDDPATTP